MNTKQEQEIINMSNEDFRWEEEEEEEEEEEDYDEDNVYYNYGTQEDGSFMVAGGGLSNGNAYATIEKRNGKYYYCEYGKNAWSQYEGDTLKWIEKSPTWHEDTTGEFVII